MRRELTWTLMLCLAVAVVAALASAATAQESQPPGHIVGHVRDMVNSGALLDGVLVEALSGTTVVASTSTHSGGSYDLALAAGTYGLRYSLAGYETVTIDDVSIAAGQTTTLDVGLTSSSAAFQVLVAFNGIGDGGWIGGEGWLAKVNLTVTADDPETPTNPDIELTHSTDAQGAISGFEALPGIEPGWFVTVTDGVTTKTHTVTDVSITSVDPATDIVRVAAHTFPKLSCTPSAAQGIYDKPYFMVPDPDASGEWLADFSGLYDITPGSQVDVLEIDDESDSTAVVWNVPRPGGWQHNPATGHGYRFFLHGRSWADAEAYAVSLGGHLATINDAAEQDWLVATFGTEYWIGLNDRAVGGAWVWASGEPLSFTGWLPGEPTGYTGEDCAMISNWGPIGWNDIPEDSAWPFVVEVGPDTTPPTTKALAASVVRGRKVTFRFRVNDRPPSCGRAVVEIQIRKRTAVIKRIAVGTRTTNTALSYRYEVWLKRGTYNWRVLATDIDGNSATRCAAATLTVK